MSRHAVHDDSLRGPLARAIWRLAWQSSVAVVFALVASLVVIGAAAVCLRPESFAAGFGRVVWGVLSFLGTVAAGTVPLLAFFSAFLCVSRLSRRGESLTLATLGLGPGRLWCSLWPLWAVFALMAFVFAFIVEPSAWRTVHQLRGSPEAAAVGWARLQAGELRVLPGGGALSLREGVLRFADGAGGWQGTVISPSPATSAPADGWDFGPSRVRGSDGSLWQFRSVRLRFERAALERYLAPPRSPWATDSLLLSGRQCEAAEDADCERATLVLHRRVSCPVLVLIMALLGWVLAWSPARRGRAHSGLGWRVLLPPLGLYCCLKIAEFVVSKGLLSGVVAAWSPSMLAVALLLWFWKQSEGPLR